MSETQAGPQVTGKMFLFERPELLTKEQHGGLGLVAPEKRYGFCADARAIPLTVGEVPSAMKDYPIIFMSQEQPVMLAVTGLIDDVNLFVDENGDWEENRYVPAYVRRHPFGLASETGGERMAVVLDRGFDGVADGGEQALFENGEPTQVTQTAVEFCKKYEQDRQVTEEFAKRLLDFDLLRPQTGQYTPTGASEPRSFAQYVGIDEERFNALSDEQIIEMRKNGMLPIVHALLMSLGNWRLILQRRARRFNLTEDQILNQAIN